MLLFALSPEAAAALGACFEQGRVQKTYLGVVRGRDAGRRED